MLPLLHENSHLHKGKKGILIPIIIRCLKLQLPNRPLLMLRSQDLFHCRRTCFRGPARGTGFVLPVEDTSVGVSDGSEVPEHTWKVGSGTGVDGGKECYFYAGGGAAGDSIEDMAGYGVFFWSGHDVWNLDCVTGADSCLLMFDIGFAGWFYATSN
jgi:hypothetical protein